MLMVSQDPCSSFYNEMHGQLKFRWDYFMGHLGQLDKATLPQIPKYFFKILSVPRSNLVSKIWYHSAIENNTSESLRYAIAAGVTLSDP